MTLDIPVAGTALDPGLWSGKRRSPRKRRTLTVECRGHDGSCSTGHTVDVSRGGMLLALVDGDLRAPSNPAELVAFASELASRFPDGIDVGFGGGAVVTKATVVRLVASPAAASPILLGCRFDPELTDSDCRLLGIELDGDETRRHVADDGLPAVDDAVRAPTDDPELLAPARTPAAAERTLHRADDVVPVARARRTARTEVVAHLFPAAIPFIGPRYRGRLTALRTRALEVDVVVPAGLDDPEGYVAALGTDARVVCLRDGRVLWETKARVHRLEVRDGVVRATLRADKAPDTATRRAMGVLDDVPETPEAAA
ncbi:MAG: PilZ domain-containing protein [Planctomycetes bacterium]|nr:PilZ domain-containing protein [Planctomycetota bacterium]